jgi:hypothetical protein
MVHLWVEMVQSVVRGVAKGGEDSYNTAHYVSPSLAEGGTMKARTYLTLLAVACLVVGGCTIPSLSINVEPAGSPETEATGIPLEEITPLVVETAAPEATAAEPEAPTATNTLVVPPTGEQTATPEPPAAAPTEGTSDAPTEEPEAPASPIPTAVVDPELVALWEYAMALREEVAEPLEEMVTALDDLGVGSGSADILAICTGVDVVVATIDEVQQGLDQVGAPPVDDPDLQEAYDESNAALNDLDQCFRLLQDACQTKNLGAILEAAEYLESGAVHMENAAEAIDRWEDKVGL